MKKKCVQREWVIVHVNKVSWHTEFPLPQFESQKKKILVDHKG